MSISIFKSDGRTALQLECDASRSCVKFLADDGQGFIAQRRLATEMGWKETTQRGGRIFLCPACAKKLTYAKN